MRTPQYRHSTALLRYALSLLLLTLLLLTSLAGQLAGQQELAATTSETEDARLADGIRSRLQAIGGLREIEVEVESGVVRLGGIATSTEARDTAEEITSRIAGVALVDNQIEISKALRDRLGPTLSQLRDLLYDWLLLIPLLGIALVAFSIAWFLARFLRAREQPFDRLIQNPFLRELARQATSGIVLALGLLVALEILGATSLVAAVLGTAGVLGLALGFAFRDLVENYIASVLLSIRQPFAPRDHVVIDDREGRVMRLTSRATILMTPDGNHLRIPNSAVFKATILNYTRNPTRRFDIAVGVGTDEDLIEAQRLGVEAIASVPGVLTDPPPRAVIVELGDSSVVVRFYGWVDQRHHSFGNVRGEVIRRVKTVLEEDGFDLPEPIHRVRLDDRRGATPPAKKPQAPAGEGPSEAELRSHDELDSSIQAELESGEENLLGAAAREE